MNVLVDDAVLHGVANKIREKTKSDEMYYPADMAAGVNDVYEAGKASMIDESKIIEKTVSGKIISVDDVSEIPHEVGIQLTSDTVTDFSGVTVTRIGKNLLDKEKWIAKLKKTDEAGATTYTAIIDGYECIAIHPAGHTVETGKYMLGEFKENTQYVFSFIGKADISNYTGLVIKYTDGSNELLRLAQTTWTKYSCVSSINKTIECFGMYFYSGTYGYYADFQIEVGVAATSYEPYIEAKEFTPNADGTVEGITSISPNMTVFTDNADVNITMDYHQSYGAWLEWNKFWDDTQDFGKKTDYWGAFAGLSPAVFYPKYDIKPTDAAHMFRSFGARGADRSPMDLEERMRECGRVLDFSQTTGMAYFIYVSNIVRVGVINAINVGNFNYAFYAASALKIVDKFIISDSGNQTFVSAFQSANNLEQIFFEGVIGQDISFQWSTKLSKASIESIINALSSTSSGTTLTLSSTAVTNAFGSTTATEWTDLIATKSNWTISLV